MQEYITFCMTISIIVISCLLLSVVAMLCMRTKCFLPAIITVKCTICFGELYLLFRAGRSLMNVSEVYILSAIILLKYLFANRQGAVHGSIRIMMIIMCTDKLAFGASCSECIPLSHVACHRACNLTLYW